LRWRNRRWLDICLVLGNRPGQTLRTFLTNHLAETAAIDFFTLLTAAFRFFVFVVRSHHRRRVLHFGVTEYPGLGWFCIPFAHISRTLTFYLSSSSLLPVCFLAFSRETVNTEALHLLKVMPTSSASFSSSLPATASLPRLSMPW
jgi:hypothetical protein